MHLEPDHDLPEVNATALALAYAAAAIETFIPGFLDKWVEFAESGTLKTEIRRLRSAPLVSTVTDKLLEAERLVQHSRLVARAYAAGELKQPKRRKRR